MMFSPSRHKQPAAQTHIPALCCAGFRAPVPSHHWAFPQHLQPWPSLPRLLPWSSWVVREVVPTPWRNPRALRQTLVIWCNSVVGRLCWGISERGAPLRCSGRRFSCSNTGCLAPAQLGAGLLVFFFFLICARRVWCQSARVGLHLPSVPCSWHMPGFRGLPSKNRLTRKLRVNQLRVAGQRLSQCFLQLTVLINVQVDIHFFHC